MKRFIKSNATSTTSDVRTYQNRRNENKFIETKKYKDGHSVARQYMKWDTPEGEVKNYTGSKSNRGRWFRAGQHTRDMMLDDYDEVVVDETIESAAELDDRFAFSFDDIEPEFWLKTTADNAKMYLVDSEVIGDGAGMRYYVVIAIPRDDNHWQMLDDIEENLDRHIQEVVDGTDYIASVYDVESVSYGSDFVSIPDDVAQTSAFYIATIEIVPIENIDAYGNYKIGAWDEDANDIPFR